MESGIQLKEFRNLTNDWNPNPIPGIQIPRMSWISLHGSEVSFLVKTIIHIFSSDESQISREKKKLMELVLFTSLTSRIFRLFYKLSSYPNKKKTRDRS